MRKIIGANLPLLLIIFTAAAAATATTQAAYGQESLMFEGTDKQKRALVDQVIADLQNRISDNSTEIPDIFMFDNGEIDIYFDNNTQGIYTDDLDIHGVHNYTNENGYDFEDGVILKPDGTPLFSSSERQQQQQQGASITFVQTSTQNDIDGDGMLNKNDQNDDNDGKSDFLDDDDDNDNIADPVDPILNTPEQQASSPPITTTTPPPIPLSSSPLIPPSLSSSLLPPPPS